jgi:biotin carboxylase
MRKVLLFSRQPLAKRALHEWLDNAADSVVLLTSRDAVDGMAGCLDDLFLDHVLVDDYHSWATEQVAEAAARVHGVELVASTSESDVLRAARLRTRLGLAGQDIASAIAYRDKLHMKRLAHAAGIAVPASAAVENPIDLLDFIDNQGLPVVVKPRFGAGAEGVWILRRPEQVMAFLGNERRSTVPYLPGQWMVESFVRGDFFHVDGIMRDGRVVHCWPSQYNSGVAEWVQGQPHLSSSLLGADDPRTELLTRLAHDVVSTLPAAGLPCAFHLEAWIDGAGTPVLCEIASRAGGGPIAEGYERCFGVELAKEGLRAQCGSTLTLDHQPGGPETPFGWVLFAAGRGTFVPPAELCPVPGVTFSVELPAGTRRQGAERASDVAAKALIVAETVGQVRQRARDVSRWWHDSASWT